LNYAYQSGATQSGELLSFEPGLRYLLGVPRELNEAQPIVVCIHGIRRNVQEQFRAFAPLAEQAGWLLLVPLFAADSFPDYQRLGRPGRGGRADLSLIELIAHLNSRFSLPERAIHLFGHSGGAQFVHRFVMVHPHHVARYAISAPGWYTFPDESLFYPCGLARGAAQGELLCASDFLRIQGAVFVGTDDCRRGRNLRRNPSVDIQQGDHRLERAMRWTSAMNARAREMGLREPLKLHRLQDGAHNFSGLVRRNRLHEHVWEFLTSSAETDT
jgi:pimeloyl-ACP methyl ester carboxylesterase